MGIPSTPSIYIYLSVKSLYLCTHIYTFLHLVSYLERNIELQNIMQSFDLPFIEEIEIPADNGKSDDTMTSVVPILGFAYNSDADIIGN